MSNKYYPKKSRRFIEKLEDFDDVQKVHSNFDIDDAEMDKIVAAGE